MSAPQKYPLEFYLDFRSVDRFLYRVCDLHDLPAYSHPELLERLDNCHIYMLGKRPRLSVVPGSLQVGPDYSELFVQYSKSGRTVSQKTFLPTSQLMPAGYSALEYVHSISEYPHREIITHDKSGKFMGSFLIANRAHTLSGVDRSAQDLEIVYVGKGLRKSAQDRLENHSTLQRILADVHSNDPDCEVFALVYAFDYRKSAWAVKGNIPLISEQSSSPRMVKVKKYRPSLDEKINLVEAACISYFRTDKYNSHYLDFPNRGNKILNSIYAMDVAAIVVQVDNENIGFLRTFSKKIEPNSTHHVVVDFREREGMLSIFSGMKMNGQKT